jgi:hypothetical protein
VQLIVKLVVRRVHRRNRREHLLHHHRRILSHSAVVSVSGSPPGSARAARRAASGGINGEGFITARSFTTSLGPLFRAGVAAGCSVDVEDVRIVEVVPLQASTEVTAAAAGAAGVFEVRCKVLVYGTGLDTSSARLVQAIEGPSFKDTLAVALSETLVYTVRSSDVLLARPVPFPFSAIKFYEMEDPFRPAVTRIPTSPPTAVGALVGALTPVGGAGGVGSSEGKHQGDSSAGGSGGSGRRTGVGAGAAAATVVAVGVGMAFAGCFVVATVQWMAPTRWPYTPQSRQPQQYATVAHQNYGGVGAETAGRLGWHESMPGRDQFVVATTPAAPAMSGAV